MCIGKGIEINVLSHCRYFFIRDNAGGQKLDGRRRRKGGRNRGGVDWDF